MNKLIDNHTQYKNKFRRDYDKSPETFVLKPFTETSASTIKQYVDKIRKNHYRLNNIGCRDIEEVLTKVFTTGDVPDSDLKYLKRCLVYINQSLPVHLKEIYPNKNTLKANLVPYVKLLRILANHDDIFRKTYFFLSRYIIDLNEDYEYTRDDNNVADEDRDKIITDYDMNTLLENVDKLNDLRDKLIYALYTMIPPRRLEYTSIELTTESYRFKMSNEKNYLVMKKKKPVYFVWNKYKTSNTYGKIEVDIPPELADIILDYIKVYNLKTGMKLIDLQQSNFIRIIETIFKKVYDVAGIGVRWLRISYSTHINGMNISNNEKQKLTFQCGHSAVQSTKYRKILDDET